MECKDKKFYLNGQQLFLTYAQCDLTPDEAKDQLSGKVQIVKYIIAQEEHKDGGKHLHCYLKLGKRFQTKDPRELDLKGAETSTNGAQVFHGRYEGCRSYTKVQRYCKKEGNYITNMEFEVCDKPIDVIKMAQGNDIDGALNMANNLLPTQVLFQKANLNKSVQLLAEEANPEEMEDYYEADTFKEIAGIQGWDRSSHALWIYRPSGVGKTEYAKTLFKNPLICNGHMDAMKEFNRLKHDGIIFNDMNYLHWPIEAQIHICDIKSRTQVNVKHGHVNIPAKVPRVFTSNRCIFHGRDPAIKRRVRFIEVKEIMYKNKKPEDKENSLEIPDIICPIPNDPMTQQANYTYFLKRDGDMRDKQEKYSKDLLIQQNKEAKLKNKKAKALPPTIPRGQLTINTMDVDDE